MNREDPQNFFVDEDCGCARHERCWACCPHPPDRVVAGEFGSVVCLDCHEVFPSAPVDVPEEVTS